MLRDLSTLPVSGGALFAGAAYAALSLFVTGPLVAERIIEKSGWPARCASRSLAEATAETSSLPSLDCGAVWGRFASLQATRAEIVRALAASRKVSP